jgi:uncharacterized protein
MIELKPQYIELTQTILSAHLPRAQLQAFGSRTTGRAKPFSDLDLAILDDERFSDRELATARYALEESSLPICVDLVRWSHLPQSLRNVIEQTGVLFCAANTRCCVTVLNPIF